MILKQKAHAVTLEMLKPVIEASWCAETSDDPAGYRLYGKDNPAYCQCRATAPVVQKYLGGHLLFSTLEFLRVPHHYNILDDGTMVDLTFKQFDNPPYSPGTGSELLPPRRESRSFVFASCATSEQYETLDIRVAAVLEGMKNPEIAIGSIRRK